MKLIGTKPSEKIHNGKQKRFGLANVFFLCFIMFALFVLSIGCSQSGGDDENNEANNARDNAIVDIDTNTSGARAEGDNGSAGTGGSPLHDSGDTQSSIQDVNDGNIIDSSNTPTDAAVPSNADSLVDVAKDIDAQSADIAVANEDSGADASVDAEVIDSDISLDGEIEPCANCCADGFERGAESTSARLVAHLTDSPEGVTVCPNGDVFVALAGLLSNSAEIVRVPLDGSEPEIWVSHTGNLYGGLTCDRKSRIFAAGIATTEPAYVVMVTGKDDPGTPLPLPSGDVQFTMGNGIVAIDRPDGLLVYASDNSTKNLIGLWKERPDGQFDATIAATDIVGPNGLSYNPKTNRLYAGGSQANNVLSFEIAQDGSLGEPQVEWTRSESGYVDGIAIDENGIIYVASYTTGEIVRTSDEKIITTDVVNPASLAFRGSELLITDWKMLTGLEGGLYAIDLGVCGMLLR